MVENIPLAVYMCIPNLLFLQKMMSDRIPMTSTTAEIPIPSLRFACATNQNNNCAEHYEKT